MIRLNKTDELVDKLKKMDLHIKKVKTRNSHAGGANTNHNGNSFEKNTDAMEHFLKNGYKKVKLNKLSNKYYLKKQIENKTIICFKKETFQNYFKSVFDIKLPRKPDEAFLITTDNKNYILKILEKKSQKIAGSVDLKLYTGAGFIVEYNKNLKNLKNISFKVEYAYCINNWMYNNIYLKDNFAYKEFNEMHNINVFQGDLPNYMQHLHQWVEDK